jgi:ribosomal protein S18 acetylase RimI-like enzyme
MPETIGALYRQDLEQASHLLTRAFREDPILTHYLSDPIRRAVALPAFFEAVLEELMPSAQVFAARSGSELTGVAAWLPPNPKTPDDAALQRARRAREIVQHAFPITSTDLYAGFAALEVLHPKDPHWYLAFIGVEPRVQGQGVGNDLLAPVLHIADETATVCYLETPFPRTHGFYERLGFRKQGEHHTFKGAPHGVVSFVRPAGQ